MFIKLILLVIGILAIAFIALGFNIFLRNKKFPQTSVGKNKNMAKLGLSCAKHEEIKCRREIDKRTEYCSSCGCS
ncbi:MAG: hypothetical protein A2X13_00460 [Bacteroidetes bacterium GWC2_33_15]|nr:MAG: hypothetical protein A2X10_04270 [Bacteroidetes bacterium GWA2_33_15]OFX51094.1 MAG: hypothetical protein A2X13_00460 [Bacteroidetes bacterium GWC2_33_15]OFX66473.1 MAG: hypothetical protein A2X15_07495 [Bacteroidetes bacterium GWB2_32_14]OFX70302.1 MAG: hypothetical protein A2X14_03350 [Bacteroidetes bacterium GWD2_33_33]HAN17301.1 hypothetical protein [Bacteroidales bacterium]